MPPRLLLNTCLLLLCCLTSGIRSFAQSKNNPGEYFTVENYYKVRWGYAEEFIHLWKVNHYPLLKKAVEKGDIISVTTAKPRLHGGEDIRWDFRVTIIFRNAALAFDPDLVTPYKKQLYPDQEKLLKEEKHRFELLLAHWDIETVSESPEK